MEEQAARFDPSEGAQIAGEGFALTAGSAIRSAIGEKDPNTGQTVRQNFFDVFKDAYNTMRDPFYMEKATALRDEANLRHQQTQDSLVAKSDVAKFMQTTGGRPWDIVNATNTGSNWQSIEMIDKIQQQAGQNAVVQENRKAIGETDIALSKIVSDNSVSGTLRGQALKVLGTQDPAQKLQMSDELFKQIPATPKAVSPIGKLQSDRASAVASGASPEIIKQFDDAIALETSNKGRAIYMGMDDDGKPMFQMTEGGANALGKPTVAMKTLAQQKLVRYENSMELLNHLSAKMTPGDVGVRGYMGEWFVDKGMQQLAEITGSPDVINRDRVDARSVLIASRESLLREIQDDKSGRFTVADREDIAKALPSSGVFESYADAKQRLDTVRGILTQRSKNYAKSIGQTPPLWTLSIDEIKAEYQKHQKDSKQGIDKETARDAIQRFHPEADL